MSVELQEECLSAIVGDQEGFTIISICKERDVRLKTKVVHHVESESKNSICLIIYLFYRIIKSCLGDDGEILTFG